MARLKTSRVGVAPKNWKKTRFIADVWAFLIKLISFVEFLVVRSVNMISSLPRGNQTHWKETFLA